MALNIKDPEADRLARELARRTGESVSQAVVRALRERLAREEGNTPVSLRAEIMEISRRASSLKVRTGKSAEEIIDYDDRGLPR